MAINYCNYFSLEEKNVQRVTGGKMTTPRTSNSTSPGPKFLRRERDGEPRRIVGRDCDLKALEGDDG